MVNAKADACYVIACANGDRLRPLEQFPEKEAGHFPGHPAFLRALRPIELRRIRRGTAIGIADALIG
jgi:hypothetical protein